MFNRNSYSMPNPISKSLLNDIILTEVRKALKETLSPEAQKALEKSRIAKQNKDAQKKRAGAKDSMKGISVECACPIEEQFVDEGSHEATELENYISNDRNLYQQYKAIIKNLKNKVVKGVYNPEKAITLWMYLVTAGAKKYAQENGSPGDRMQDLFPKSVRIEVAKSFRDASADVIGAQMPVMEQNVRMPGDKLSADEDPMADFDTSEFYKDEPFDVEQYDLEDEPYQDSFFPEDEKIREQRMFDDDTDDADIFSNSAEEKFFSAKVPPRKTEKSFEFDMMDDDDEDMYDVFDGMDVMGPEGTETFDRDKHVPTPSEYTEEDALLDVQEAEEEQGLYTDPETGAGRDDSFWGRM